MERAVVKEYWKAINGLGCEVVSTGHTGRSHYKITVRKGGHQHFFIASATPSDVRSIRQFTKVVKHWLREIGEAA